MPKITTPLRKFREEHPSSIAASYEAIERLTGLFSAKTYYRDPTGQFTVFRRGGKVTVTGDRGWVHEKTAKNIEAAYICAKVEAEVYQNWMNCWGKETKVTYTFGCYTVTGTRNDKSVEWSVARYSHPYSYKIVTSDMAISVERAEVVLFNFLDSRNGLKFED